MASRRPVYRGECKSGESKGREADGGGGGTHGMANVVSAHKDKRRKRGRLHKGPGTTWGSKFNLKTKVQRRALIQQPWKYPIAAHNLAAIEIQRHMRGFMSRKRSSKKRRASMSMPGTPAHREMSMKEKYELKKLAKAERKLEEELAKEYDMWCRERIQAWWRMLMVKQEYERNRFSMYHMAAMQIQYLWKAFTRERYMDLSKPPLRVTAAAAIQRAWRRYTNLRIFHYYRDLIRFRNTGDPALMLRSINPREASLVDRASGLRVRFRLGGNSFPPQIYYKIFTRAPLCDLGAFAPRDYTRVRGVNAAQRHNRPSDPPLQGHGPDDDRIVDAAIDAGTGLVVTQGRSTHVSMISRAAADYTTPAEAATGGKAHKARTGKGAFASINMAEDMKEQYDAGYTPEGWYRRHENNGWRPVSLKTLEDANKDPVTVATNKLATSFHYSKVKRQEDAVRKRKQRKRQWLMKMYKEGLAQERAAAGAGGAGAGTDGAGAGGGHAGGGRAGTGHGGGGGGFGGTTGTIADVVDVGKEDWEEHADHLLNWSSTLDFDSYVADWQAVGTSGLPAAADADGEEPGTGYGDGHGAGTYAGSYSHELEGESYTYQ